MKNKPERIFLPDFKTYYKATVIRMVSYWWKNRLMEWNTVDRTEYPETDAHSQPVFDEEAKAILKMMKKVPVKGRVEVSLPTAVMANTQHSP